MYIYKKQLSEALVKLLSSITAETLNNKIHFTGLMLATDLKTMTDVTVFLSFHRLNDKTTNCCYSDVISALSI